MLELKDIRKEYMTAGFAQVALDDVSISLRDNEFAAILGPSGSGKTTLLNILGGLDHADSGDIVINGVSTKNYTDRDWDTYRNHRIGFIFQSYNLIPHQTIRANVELALTLAGIPKAERRARALAALERVGLEKHADKRPSQLSGGQMQRVAIARALVNDPDIVLADEPTGALDTETGLQVMDLLAEIAQNRLVVMVTHNPELAETYATRIIRLQDGHIAGDTNPLDPDGTEVLPRLAMTGAKHARPHAADDEAPATGVHPARHKASDTSRHASMSFLTALSLSFNNLMTKKGRTFMTAFAGSIGIIGIAAILALSNGTNDYIDKTEREALSSYPLTITKSSFDITSLLTARIVSEEASSDEKAGLIPQNSIMSDMFAEVKSNDLASFRAFLESGESGIEPYVSTITYSYGLNPLIYKSDTSAGVTRLNPSRMSSTLTNGLAGSSLMGGSSMSSFYELNDDREILEQGLILEEGTWPTRYDECVLILNQEGGLSDYTLYSLGVYDIKVMERMLDQALTGEDVDVPNEHVDFSRDDAMDLHFAVVPPSVLYRHNSEQDSWTDMSSNVAYMRKMLAEDAIDLHVVGIVRETESGSTMGISEGIGYTSGLTRHLMSIAARSDIVAWQKKRPDVDVFTGKTFEELKDENQASFDLESVFSVDSEALQAAFSFDSDALSGLGASMDLSSLMSGVDFSSAFADLDLTEAFKDADLSDAFADMDLSSIMSGLDKKQLAQDLEAALKDSGAGQVSLDDKQLSALTKTGSKLLKGFGDYLVRKGIVRTEDGTLRKPDAYALATSYLADTSSGAQQALDELFDKLEEQLGTEQANAILEIVQTWLTEDVAGYLTLILEDVDPSTIDGEFLRDLVEQAPPLDTEQLAAVIGAEVLTKAASQTAAELASGFASWLLENPQLVIGKDAHQGDSGAYLDLVARYLKTKQAKALISSVTSGLTEQMASGVSEAIAAVMAQYMQGIASEIEAALRSSVQAMAQQLGGVLAQTLAQKMGGIGSQMGLASAGMMAGMSDQLASSIQGALSVDGDAFADAIHINMSQEDLASMLSGMLGTEEHSFEANLNTLGYGELENPESISIYPISFDAKESVLQIVDDYNNRMSAEGREDAVIQYTDFAGVLMSSVTSIVNNISSLLIAFVSISLVVSSIMIAIITYISVLERKKEIGILRAMGASKLNVANIFNAETMLLGLFSGLLAVTSVWVASFPINEHIYQTRNVENIMRLHADNAAALVAISVGLTLMAGLIPSSAAARRDPVEALRSE